MRLKPIIMRPMLDEHVLFNTEMLENFVIFKPDEFNKIIAMNNKDIIILYYPNGFDNVEKWIRFEILEGQYYLKNDKLFVFSISLLNHDLEMIEIELDLQKHIEDDYYLFPIQKEFGNCRELLTHIEEKFNI